MKNYTILTLAITILFSFNCIAQRNDQLPYNEKTGNVQLMPNGSDDDVSVVVSYHVEERINMNFGSSITTYNVSNLNLVNTNDLGKNNTRIITPRFAKVKAVAVVAKEQPKAPIEIATTTVLPIKMVATSTDVKAKYVNINILSTYERVIDKGYKSVDMLKRVGNGRYFDGDLVMAAKWYSQLFAITTDLEAVYFYRYAQSLKSVNQMEKANEMMAVFENKNSIK